MQTYLPSLFGSVCARSPPSEVWGKVSAGVFPVKTLGLLCITDTVCPCPFRVVKIYHSAFRQCPGMQVYR